MRQSSSHAESQANISHPTGHLISLYTIAQWYLEDMMQWNKLHKKARVKKLNPQITKHKRNTMRPAAVGLLYVSACWLRQQYLIVKREVDRLEK